MDPRTAIGNEPKFVHACLVIQNDRGNQYSTNTIVAAIREANDDDKTSFPVFVPITELEDGSTFKGVVDCGHLLSVSERRFKWRYGSLTKETMAKVDDALRISLGLEEATRTTPPSGED